MTQIRYIRIKQFLIFREKPHQSEHGLMDEKVFKVYVQYLPPPLSVRANKKTKKRKEKTYVFVDRGLVDEGDAEVVVRVGERHELRPLRGDGDPAARHVGRPVPHHLDRVRGHRPRRRSSKRVREPQQLGEAL